MSRPITQDNLTKKIRNIERSVDASTGLFPQEGFFKYAQSTGGGTNIPNTGAYVAAPSVTFTITTLGQQESWLFSAVMIVRADSANDTTVRARVYDVTAASEVAVAFGQRLYNGAGGLAGYTTLAFQGQITIPANTARTFRLEAAAQSAFGLIAYEGSGTHNNMFAQRVA